MSEDNVRDAMRVERFVNNLFHLKHALTHVCRSGTDLFDHGQMKASDPGGDLAGKIAAGGLHMLKAIDDFKSLGGSPLFPGISLGDDDPK